MTTEKHGGIWLDDTSQSGWSLVFENFDSSSQLLGAVFEKAGRFKAAIYEKSADPQWRLPWWRALQPDSLFDNQSEAVAHVHRSLSNAAAQS